MPSDLGQMLNNQVTLALKNTLFILICSPLVNSFAMPQYKLTYFQLRGKAEAIRMTLSIAGVEFEDVRVSIDDWVSKLKNCEYTAQFWLLLHNSIAYADVSRE